MQQQKDLSQFLIRLEIMNYSMNNFVTVFGVATLIATLKVATNLKINFVAVLKVAIEIATYILVT
jgi:hypothetical protein